MNNFRIKKIISVIILIIFEIVLYIMITNITPTDKYSNWCEASANIISCSTNKSSAPYLRYRDTFMTISYMDKNNSEYIVFLKLNGTYFDFYDGQTISIKYNSQNPREVIYPVYEKYLLENKKTKATIIFIITLITTITIFFCNILF